MEPQYNGIYKQMDLYIDSKSSDQCQGCKLKHKIFPLICLVLLAGCKSENLISTKMPVNTSQTTIETGTASQSIVEPISTLQPDMFPGYTVSPDKQTIAVSRLDGVYLYDSSSLNQIRFIEREISTGFSGALPVAFSPDGKYIAFSDGFGVALMDLSSNANKLEKYVVSLIPSFEISEIAISHDNSHMILYTKGAYTPCDAAGGNYALYDMNSTGWQLVIDRYFCRDHSASLFRFTETGKAYLFFWYTTAPYPYSMDVIDLSANALVKNVNFEDIGYDSEKTFYDISPSGKMAASVDYKNDATKIINLETGEALEKVNGFISFTPYPLDNEPLWSNEWSGSWYAKPAPCETTITDLQISYNKVFSDGNLSTFLVIRFFDLQQIELWDMAKCEKVKIISVEK